MNIRNITIAALVAVVASTSVAAAGGSDGLGGLGGYVPLRNKPTVETPHIQIFPQLPDPKKPGGGNPGGGDNPGDDPGDNGQSPMLRTSLPLVVDCTVHTDEATTNDMWVVNIGDTALAAGTRLAYSVPSTGDRGGFILPHDVEIGGKFLVSSLLHAAHSGASCAIRIIT